LAPRLDVGENLTDTRDEPTPSPGCLNMRRSWRAPAWSNSQGAGTPRVWCGGILPASAGADTSCSLRRP